MDGLICFNDQDWPNFQRWLGPRLEELTWHGVYEEEFKQFWNLFFLEGIDLVHLMDKFDFIYTVLTPGPLKSWFEWLERKVLFFLFTQKGISLRDILEQAKCNVPQTIYYFRQEFIRSNPKLSSFYDSFFFKDFQIESNANLYYKDIESKLSGLRSVNPFGMYFESRLNNNPIDEIMLSFEVTLYPEFHDMVTKCKKFFSNKNPKNAFQRRIRVKALALNILEMSIMLMIICGGVFLSKNANRFYENYLIKKIAEFRPDSLWSSNTENLKFKINMDSDDSLTSKNSLEEVLSPNKFLLSKKSFNEDLEQEGNLDLYENYSGDGEESDGELMAITENQISDYEEEKKGGFRDEQMGDRLVYRLHIRCVDPNSIAILVNSIMKKYEVKQAGVVRPGTKVPGGIYYNLLVPKEKKEEVFSQLSRLPDSTLYVSRTKKPSPSGMVKTFIWLKQI